VLFKERCQGTYVAHVDNDFSSAPVVMNREWATPFLNFDNVRDGRSVVTSPHLSSACVVTPPHFSGACVVMPPHFSGACVVVTSLQWCLRCVVTSFEWCLRCFLLHSVLCSSQFWFSFPANPLHSRLLSSVCFVVGCSLLFTIFHNRLVLLQCG
jgi:hypothetical protein